MDTPGQEHSDDQGEPALPPKPADKGCNAVKRNHSGYCHRPAGWGTNHIGIGRCKLHGGSTPAHTKRADDIKFDREVRAELARLDVTPEGDPLTALSTLLGQALAFKDAIADRVNELREIRYEDAKGAEQLRSEVALWERALDRCEKFATSMARLNIDERLAAIQEKQAEMVADALAAVLAELGMTYEQQREARRGLARRLRLVGGG